MNGFLLIDKASGINSFKLVLALRKIAAQKRVGFAGTLDPLASGLMVLASGE
jgi:tRNA pseudouridine55 synthase